MEFLVGEKVLYCKVYNDKSTEELVDILHINNESKSATIYIPSLKRERDTVLSRLYYQKLDDKIDFTLPKRNNPFIYEQRDLFSECFYGKQREIKLFNIKEILFTNLNYIQCDNKNNHIGLYSCPNYQYVNDDSIFIQRPQTSKVVSANISCVFQYLRDLYTNIDTIYESINKVSGNQEKIYTLQEKKNKELQDMIKYQKTYIHLLEEKLETVIKNQDELKSQVKILINKSNEIYKIPDKKTD
jgi:hypothetical protein